jgi:hypothetical protein
MSDLVAELTAQARRLPAADRARLAEELLSTVQQEVADPEIERDWDAELARRISEIDAGTAKLHLASDVLAEIRALIK